MSRTGKAKEKRKINLSPFPHGVDGVAVGNGLGGLLKDRDRLTVTYKTTL